MSKMLQIPDGKTAAVLAALYNNSRVLGMGVLQAIPGHIMTEEEANDLLEFGGETEHRGGRIYFDYLYGKVMKVDLTGDEFNPWLYDRDNGEGAAAKAIAEILFEAEVEKLSNGTP